MRLPSDSDGVGEGIVGRRNLSGGALTLRGVEAMKGSESLQTNVEKRNHKVALSVSPIKQ